MPKRFNLWSFRSFGLWLVIFYIFYIFDTFYAISIYSNIKFHFLNSTGKTTLIKLILGKYKPIAGQVKAFGYNVWEKRSGMIGSGVGYMPQELALIFDFTIEEQLYYFGRLYCMAREEIKREINYLCNILDLPEKERLLHHLSGGQQHRVSFACALIHRPRLMILDGNLVLQIRI